MSRIKKGIIIYDKIILADLPEKRAGFPDFVPSAHTQVPADTQRDNRQTRGQPHSAILPDSQPYAEKGHARKNT